MRYADRMCFVCAATEADGATFPRVKAYGARRLCDACIEEARLAAIVKALEVVEGQTDV